MIKRRIFLCLGMKSRSRYVLPLAGMAAFVATFSGLSFRSLSQTYVASSKTETARSSPSEFGVSVSRRPQLMAADVEPPARYLPEGASEWLGQSCIEAIATVDGNLQVDGAYIGYARFHDESVSAYAPRPDRLTLQLDADDTVVQGGIVQSSSALALLDATPQLTEYAQLITRNCSTFFSVIFRVSSIQSTEIGLRENNFGEFPCASHSGPDVPEGFRYCNTSAPDTFVPSALLQASSSCRDALAQFTTALERDYNAYVDYLALSRSSTSSPASPPGFLYISLDAYNVVYLIESVAYSAAIDALEDTEQLAGYAEDILDGCATVGTVRFVAGTDYIAREFGWLDGQIVEMPLPWSSFSLP